MAQETTVQINAHLVWRFTKTPRGGVIAECDPLGLVLEADDEAEAKSIVEESLHYFFLDHFAEGTLADFLRSRGWSLQSPLPPKPLEGDLVRFNVPWTVEPVHAA